MIKHAMLWSALLSTIAACELPSSAFGRSCSNDDGCVDATGSAPTCHEGQCVSAAYLEAIAEDPDDPDDPDDPEDPEDPEVPAGDTCDDAIPLTLDVLASGTTSTALDDHDALCGGDGKPDRAYVVQLAASTNLRVTLTPGGFDGALYASTNPSCAFDTVIAGACVDVESNVGGVEELALFDVGPGPVYIVVDGANQNLLPTSGTYTLIAREDIACDVGFVAVNGRCLGIQAEVEAAVARTNATATLLDDGNVLVVGGRTGADLTATTSVEIFHADTETFSDAGPMNTARARHAAEKLADGRVLVVGGVDDNGTPTATVEVYDPVSNTFSPAPPLPRRRDLTTATQLGQGRGILVVGGRDGSSTLGDVLTIDPNLTAWTARTSLAEPRYGHVVAVVDGGAEVLLIGGRAGSNGTALETVESFDPRSNSLSSSTSLPAARAAAVGVAVSQQRAVVFGGYEGNSDSGFAGKASVVAYDVDSEVWTELFADMSEPRLFATATSLPGLGVVIAGGSQDDPTASMELYVDGDEAFVALPPLHKARLAHAAVALQDGRILFVGGDGGDASETVPLATAELFGPQR